MFPYNEITSGKNIESGKFDCTIFTELFWTNLLIFPFRLFPRFLIK